MAARRPTNARLAAGVFLALVAARLPALPLRIAAERPGDGCPDGPGLSLLRVEPGTHEDGPSARCLALLPVKDLSDSALDAAVAGAARRPGRAGVIVEFASLPETGSSEFSIRVPYAIKKLASAIRAASPDAEVAFDLTIGAPPGGSKST